MKKKFGLLFWGILSLGIVFTSCNQTGLGALTAARNIITSPIRAINGAISESRYNDIAQSSNQELELPLSGQSDCLETTNLVMDIDPYEGLMQATRSNICTCRAWGTCRKNLCSCETLCPAGFEIFKKPPLIESTDDLTAKEHSLSFRNMEAMRLASIEGTQGYCWGHASLTSQFNRLGFFQPSNSEMLNHLNGALGSERDEALEFYKEIIDDIADNKVREIPGFANLSELSSHPDLQSYMADVISREWADRAMTFSGLRTAIDTRSMSPEAGRELIEDVSRRLEHNYQPQIIFTDKHNRFRTHAVLVSSVREEEGRTVLCIRDNNYRPSTNEDCKNKMYYEADRNGFYYEGPGWRELGRVSLAHNNDADVVSQHRSLTRHCKSIKDCP
jgi:hypothetical protein